MATKEYHQEYSRRYYQRNRDKVIAANLARYYRTKTTPNRIKLTAEQISTNKRAYLKRWYQANKERVKAYRKQWYANKKASKLQELKECTRCHILKPLSEWPTYSRCYCRQCYTELQHQQYLKRKNPKLVDITNISDKSLIKPDILNNSYETGSTDWLSQIKRNICNGHRTADFLSTEQRNQFWDILNATVMAEVVLQHPKWLNGENNTDSAW